MAASTATAADRRVAVGGKVKGSTAMPTSPVSKNMNVVQAVRISTVPAIMPMPGTTVSLSPTAAAIGSTIRQRAVGRVAGGKLLPCHGDMHQSLIRVSI